MCVRRRSSPERAAPEFDLQLLCAHVLLEAVHAQPALADHLHIAGGFEKIALLLVWVRVAARPARPCASLATCAASQSAVAFPPPRAPPEPERAPEAEVAVSVSGGDSPAEPAQQTPLGTPAREEALERVGEMEAEVLRQRWRRAGADGSALVPETEEETGDIAYLDALDVTQQPLKSAHARKFTPTLLSSHVVCAPQLARAVDVLLVAWATADPAQVPAPPTAPLTCVWRLEAPPRAQRAVAGQATVCGQDGGAVLCAGPQSAAHGPAGGRYARARAQPRAHTRARSQSKPHLEDVPSEVRIAQAVLELFDDGATGDSPVFQHARALIRGAPSAQLQVGGRARPLGTHR